MLDSYIVKDQTQDFTDAEQTLHQLAYIPNPLPNIFQHSSGMFFQQLW